MKQPNCACQCDYNVKYCIDALDYLMCTSIYIYIDYIIYPIHITYICFMPQ